jgi:hypothetical protein
VVRPALGLTHASSITPLTHHEREQTRGGIADCAWADLTERDDIDALSDAELVRGIERHCDGGWRAFFVPPRRRGRLVTPMRRQQCSRQPGAPLPP